MNGLTISQVAKSSNVNIETIRYYERRGLISEPPRTDSGYRMFPPRVVQDIEFIKRAQDLGFTLEEIKDLLSASRGDEEFHSEEMHDFASGKIEEIEKKIRDLNEMKLLLEALVEKCPRSGVPKNQCPIINQLTKGVN
ncbi:MerR family transcriptional regulator [Brevibacillus centrosporus]|uniref:MerR family transcriptional regulator n=1 Tax=Brevibacillus centrosporus TaxID=54910 RepID=UPI001145078D|nr:MerR family transcriptional regulator [Brevibacillus centrosporus]MEC2133263.1 MerR family transcriptional regulator [Brevibacillus centrosporus]GED34783.1 Hg(II)-responsive transcriptional regulator [Brevibacillus centrosporus]